MQSKWPEPKWITSLANDQREAARVRFYLNLAATFATEGGSLTALAEATGIAYHNVVRARERGRVPPEMAVALEETLGRESFPRELFNPIFIVGER